jgi:hypothetical protein
VPSVALVLCHACDDADRACLDHATSILAAALRHVLGAACREDAPPEAGSRFDKRGRPPLRTERQLTGPCRPRKAALIQSGPLDPGDRKRVFVRLLPLPVSG